MLLPIPQHLDRLLEPPEGRSRELAQRFLDAVAVPLDALSPLVPEFGGDSLPRIALAPKQARYDRYFGVERSAASPTDTLIRAGLETVREMSVDAAAGHSLSPLEEHILIAALRQGLQMLCPPDFTGDDAADLAAVGAANA